MESSIPPNGSALHTGSSMPRSAGGVSGIPSALGSAGAVIGRRLVAALLLIDLPDRYLLLDALELSMAQYLPVDQLVDVTVRPAGDDARSHRGRDARKLLDVAQRRGVEVGRPLDMDALAAMKEAAARQ